jgi:Arc/MetJ-type ribon-helix-helix transcriptional regulator
MPNMSTKSSMVSFRLPNEVKAIIEKAINSQTNHNSSVSDYCRENIIRYATRHMSKQQQDELLGAYNDRRKGE